MKASGLRLSRTLSSLLKKDPSFPKPVQLLADPPWSEDELTAYIELLKARRKTGRTASALVESRFQAGVEGLHWSRTSQLNAAFR